MKDYTDGRGGVEKPLDRIVRRAEAARLLGRGVKGIDRLSAKGILRSVKFPGCRKAAGFRLSDIQALIAGTNAREACLGSASSQP